VARCFVLWLLLTLSGGCLFAGTIYGSIFREGAALRGAPFSVTCGNTSVRGSTLDDGSYRINIAQPGRCTFTVAVQGQGNASAEVMSSNGALQYNFQVVRGSGGLELRRQ
jgi:hypothetical protein